MRLRAMVYVIMGVSGSGKSTIGRMLAQRLGIEFHDADDYHPQANINKMESFIPLDDEDRLPWLSDMVINIAEWNKGKGAVLACSALKEKYRQILSRDEIENVVFIYLQGERDIIIDRMKVRKDHFFPLELLDSQFNELEEPQNAITAQIDKAPEEICSELFDKLTIKGFV
jgi:carbohydrate kinase (thermoresistant glucokinase family)